MRRRAGLDRGARRVPIRLKLATALAIPLTALGLVTVIEMVSVAREARRVRDQTELATATIGPNGLITALQNERNWTSAHLVGVDEQLALEVPGYEPTRAATDTARAQFERELDRRGETARAAYAPALEGLDALADLRGEIDVHAASPDRTLANIEVSTEMFDRYTALIEPFFGGMTRISNAMDDRQLRQGARLMETVTRQLETVPQLTNALVLPATVSSGGDDLPGIDSPQEIAEVADLHDAFRRQAEALRTATGPFADIAESHFPEEFNQSLDAQAAQAIETGEIDVEALLSGLDVPLDEAYLGYRDRIATAIEERAEDLSTSATGRQRRFGLLAVVTFGAAVALTVLVSRSITRPLRSLTRQAKDMADRRLPHAVSDILETPLGEDVVVPTVAPVRVGTHDEVSDVADALNTVQDSALDLAVEQAVLRRNLADSFVNLGRRNQNLLGRQLDFITELESGETDADTLSNLFRLDHLATRMRRNAESLLVLAGIETPRKWAGPVRLADVIRAALGEVEDYHRVTIRGVEPATISGSAAADLASACPRPTSPQPTAAWPAPSRSPSPPPSTWATTSPAISRPGTAYASTCSTPPAPASPPPSRCPPTS
ncbi:MAG TPA: nitrate- and nitrite sensing domain-containing protein [Acidimicrobiales bacterium]|nr:nitrate- and nitrite sensing domain-containing protein [Acidimicrobiales bacterium]